MNIKIFLRNRNKLNKRLIDLERGINRPKTIPMIARMGKDLAKGYAPFYSGDTQEHITIALMTKQKAIISSTSTDARFPDKHLWLNAIPGHVANPFTKKSYAQVAKTGHPLGYFNVTKDILQREFSKELGLEIRQILS